MQNTEIVSEKFNKIDFRNEKKILFTQSENYLVNFFKFLNFKEVYNKRQINSIYFETRNFSDLIDTINGEKYRSKLRLRWYGNTFNNLTKPVLENKIKINNQNFKIKHNIDYVKFKNEISSNDINNIVKNLKDLSLQSKFKIQTREPNLLVTYTRRYFMYNNVRITLDTNLKSKDFYRKKKISEKDFFKENKISIVEIKYKDNCFNDVKKITSYFSNRVGKFSKYEFSLIGN